MRFYRFVLFVVFLVALSAPALAMEVTAGKPKGAYAGSGGSSMFPYIKMLQNELKRQKDELKTLQDELDGRDVCTAKLRLYAPADPKADKHGCRDPNAEVKKCSERQAFYDPNDKAADKFGCVAPAAQEGENNDVACQTAYYVWKNGGTCRTNKSYIWANGETKRLVSNMGSYSGWADVKCEGGSLRVVKSQCHDYLEGR